LENIQQYWSPDQVAGAWNEKTWESLSKDTIYRYIHLKYPEFIKKYFRRKWRKYKYGYEPVWYIYDRVSIHERPKVDDIWHWEWDTMRWANRKWWFATFNEKESGYLLAWPLVERKSLYVTAKAHELFKKIPEELKKTLTLDNGREFCEHYMMRLLCWLETYFADPWRPWQRWANENTNWLLRQFFPKWVDVWNVSQEELDYYVKLLNNRPRKRLWYISPIEYLKRNYCFVLN
jgi:IS30 family transposase